MPRRPRITLPGVPHHVFHKVAIIASHVSSQKMITDFTLLMITEICRENGLHG